MPDEKRSSYDVRVGRNIADMREADGLSQTDLAEKLSRLGWQLSQQTVAKIESGSRPLRLWEARVFADALNCDVDVLDDEREVFNRALHIRRAFQEFDRSWDQLTHAAEAFADAQSRVQAVELTDAEQADFGEGKRQRVNIDAAAIVAAWDKIAGGDTSAVSDPNVTIDTLASGAYYRIGPGPDDAE